MLKHLISLVFLFVTLYSTAVLSDTKSLILPKIKPHKMSITNKVKTSIILPAKKPKIKIEVVTVKKDILPKNKKRGRKGKRRAF